MGGEFSKIVESKGRASGSRMWKKIGIGNKRKKKRKGVSGRRILHNPWVQLAVPYTY